MDLSDVERILRQPGPSVLRSDVHYDSSKERQVLEDIERGRKEEEEKNEARRLRIEKYEEEKAEEAERRRKEEEEKALEDERARLEEIERENTLRVEEEERIERERVESLERQEKERLAEIEKMEADRVREEEEEKMRKKAEEEAEWSRFSEERWKTVRPEAPEAILQTSSGSEEGDREGFETPPQNPEPKCKEPETIGEKPFVKGVQSHSGAKINFSDFEALSDPFGDLELKTMDDLAELRTILSTNHQHNTNQIPPTNNRSQQAFPGGQHISQPGWFNFLIKKDSFRQFQVLHRLLITSTATMGSFLSNPPPLPSPSQTSQPHQLSSQETHFPHQAAFLKHLTQHQPSSPKASTLHNSQQPALVSNTLGTTPRLSLLLKTQPVLTFPHHLPHLNLLSAHSHLAPNRLIGVTPNA